MKNTENSIRLPIIAFQLHLLPTPRILRKSKLLLFGCVSFNYFQLTILIHRVVLVYGHLNQDNSAIPTKPLIGMTSERFEEIVTSLFVLLSRFYNHFVLSNDQGKSIQ
jgi:hypothetical protein